jgi:hypothetical protein
MTMEKESDSPSAEYVGVDVKPDVDAVDIRTTGEALFVDGENEPRVCIEIGAAESGISITLSPADARALRDDVDDAIDEANDEAGKWSRRDNSRRH